MARPAPAKKPVPAPKAAKPAPAAAPTEAAIEATTTIASAADVITTYDLLLDAARVGQAKFETQGAKEIDQKYMHRLVIAISEIPEAKEGEEDVFDSLDAAVQEWYNGTVELIKGEKAIVMPDGFVSKFGKAKPLGRQPAKEKAPKVAKEKIEKPDGITVKLREIILMDLEITPEALKARLIKEGLTVNDSTAVTVRSDVLRTVKVAKRLGLWKDAD